MSDAPVDHSTAADDVLLRRWVEHGDHNAFGAIDARYRGLVFGIAHRRLGGDPVLRAGVEDVAQDVFIYLMRRAGECLASDVPLAVRLARVADSRAVDYFRRNHPHSRPSGGDPEGGGPIDHVPAPRPAEESDAESALRACLDAMPDVAAVVYPLYWEGRTAKEVAAELGVANATMSRRHDQARERLRACVERRLGRGRYSGGRA